MIPPIGREGKPLGFGVQRATSLKLSLGPPDESRLARRSERRVALDRGASPTGDCMPTEMMIRRLRVNSVVSDDEAAALRALPASVKEVPEETSLVREGERPTRCIVIMSGFAFRSKVSDTGKRQILSFHPAGDMPDLHGLLLDRMDHDLMTLSPATVAFIEHRHINRLIEE